jgi:hypothetical protein
MKRSACRTCTIVSIFATNGRSPIDTFAYSIPRDTSHVCNILYKYTPSPH